MMDRCDDFGVRMDNGACSYNVRRRAQAASELLLKDTHWIKVICVFRPLP